MEFLLYNILLILNIFPIFLSSQCTSNTNCFSCNSNNICKWDLNKCIDNETLSSSKNILNNLLQCYDYSENFYFIYQYCGNTDLFLKKDDIKITLPENNKLYGFDNIYCRYTIFNAKGKSKKFYVKIKQNKDLLPNFLLMIKSDDYSRIINEEKINFEINDSFEIYIDYYSTSSYDKNPIEITISFNKFLTLKTILLICLIFIIIVIVLVFILVLLNKKYFYLNLNSNTENKKKKEEERKVAENLFQKIKFISYNDYNDKHKNINCIICFENFSPEDKIIVNKCNHIFHYDCLKKWFIPLNSINVNNTCPECRKELFDLKNINNNNLEKNNLELINNNQNNNLVLINNNQNNNLVLINNNNNINNQNNNLELNNNNQNNNLELNNNNQNNNLLLINNNQNNNNNNLGIGQNVISLYNDSGRPIN